METFFGFFFHNFNINIHFVNLCNGDNLEEKISKLITFSTN